MIQEPPSSEERVPPMTPQLALRVAIIGTCALAMFAIIFFRLWFLQVLSGTQYVAEASSISTRSIPIAAERGEILDRYGDKLVTSVPEPTVEVSASNLPTRVTIGSLAANHDRPTRQDARLYATLASLLGISDAPVSCTVDGKQAPPEGTLGTFRMSAVACTVAQGIAAAEYANVAIAKSVSPFVQDYLAERQVDFPGVVVQEQYTRQYPYGDLAAQVLGTVGPISCDNAKVIADCETAWKHFKDIPKSDQVGQSGAEYEYNSYLQGKDGSEQVRVNAYGQFESYAPQVVQTPGYNVQLTIDPQLQRVGEQALAHSIALNGGTGGAFVALDPDNGQVLGMGSNPTFAPSDFTRPMTQTQYNQLFGSGSGDPQLNRAIQSAGPTGSTFKVITATAALESGDWSLSDTFDDVGQFCLDGECRHNAGHAVDGQLDLVNAIRVSSDDFFYNLGALTDDPAPQGGPLQEWAKLYGIGRRTAIDLPGEVVGTRPTPQWRAERNQLEQECDNLTHPTAMFPNHPDHKLPGGSCGLAVYPFESWTVGDNENMAVGQGDVQVSPLQLAVVYSALANNGTIVTPHVAEDIQTGTGTIVQKIDPAPRRTIEIDPVYRNAILTGLREAATSGTSADVMGTFPEPVYGKTGTAQYLNDGVETDYSWYACFVPRSSTNGKPIVVVVWVERGGFGDVAAAPVARQILSQWFFGTPGVYKSGTSATL